MRDATELAGGHPRRETQGSAAVGNTFVPGQVLPDTQYPRAGDDQLDRGHTPPDTHRMRAPVDKLAPGHSGVDTHEPDAGGDNLARGQANHDTQARDAPVDPLPATSELATPIRAPSPAASSPPAKPLAAPSARPPGATTSRTTNPSPTPRGPASSASAPTPGHGPADIQPTRAGGGVPHDALLALLADAVDDLEDLRTATANRLHALTALPLNELDTAKGIKGGPTVARASTMLKAIKDLEKQAIKDLERAMRAHPLGWWVKQQVGVGEKQAARLLAALGDPAARATPSQLWQYAGHGDPARSKLRKGQPVEHSPTAKMRTRLIAESCIKQAHSPYRPVYDAAREAAHGKVHAVQCQNTIRPSLTGSNGSNGCGTREHPEWGAPGSPWRPGHEHGHALRLVGKAVLLDLWRAARDLATQDLTGAIRRPTPTPCAPRSDLLPAGATDLTGANGATTPSGDALRSDCLPAPPTHSATPTTTPAGPGALPAARQGAA